MEQYDKETFLKKIIERADELGLSRRLAKEIDIYESIGYVDYLYVVYVFIKKLEESNILYSLHHIHSMSSVLAYLLGLDNLEDIDYPFIHTFIEYDKTKIPVVNVCVAANKKQEAVQILDSLVCINYSISSFNAYYFGDNNQFHISVITSPFLDRIQTLEELTGLSSKMVPLNDQNVIERMLEIDENSYFLPALAGCTLGNIKELYSYINIVKPRSLFDLIKINSITRSVYINQKRAMNDLKKNGIDFFIYSLEELQYLLVDIYDVDEVDAFYIVKDVSHGKILMEYQLNLLKSHAVPEYIINQFSNIKYLHYLGYSYMEMKYIYQLSYYKLYYPKEFSFLLSLPYQDSYVGLFFYFFNRLYSYNTKMSDFDPLRRFFDSDISHFDYFASLSTDGDYGNYPRGRVIFNNFEKMFYVYMDKTLMNEKYKREIIEKYNIDENRTIFKRDLHYRHDGL